MTETDNAANTEVLVEFSDLENGARLGTIRLNRPDSLNAITPTMLSEATVSLANLVADDTVAVIRITGAGRAFSAGVDLKALGEVKVEDGSVGSGLDQAARALIDDIEHCPKAVIAQVNGFCFTGALELALACDLIVVAQQAKLGDTHGKWGLRPTWGMSQRLPRFVGIARARELSLTARTFTGQQALEWGLAAFAPPLEELEMTVLEVAQQIAQNSAGSVAAYKDLYRRSLNDTLQGGLQYEAETDYPIGDSQERLQGFLD